MFWCAKLYENWYFDGWKHVISSEDKSDLIGKYNDQVSSIKVRNGCNFTGYNHEISKDDPKLLFSQTSDLSYVGKENDNYMTGFSCECNSKEHFSITF